MNNTYNYIDINTAASSYSPSTVHIKNTTLFNYYRKYLLQKAMSVFKITVPALWSKNYFLYVLYCIGFISVIKTDAYGVIPQKCSLSGFDVFYQPTKAHVANPHLSGIIEPEIHTQCEIIKLQPDFSSAMDIIDYFAEKMATTSEAATVNIINSKLAYVFGAKDKAAAESFKKLYDNIAKGEPATFIDKSLFNDDGSPNWMTFANNLRANYLASDMLSDLRKWETQFDTLVGIPNANTDKKERLISDEVNANKTEVYSVSDLWFETLEDTFDKTRKLFGISESELKVERRWEVMDDDSAGIEGPSEGLRNL